MKNNFNKAFTLVELIVVITILAVLATVGFISFQGYSTESRDTKRMTDIAILSKWLQVYLAANSQVPEPSETKTTVSFSGSELLTQWYAGKSVLDTLRVKEAKDPTDETFYTYSINANNTKFQVLALLEKNQTAIHFMNNKLFADYTDRNIYSAGQSVWILLDDTNTPIQELWSTTIELENNATVYKTVLNQNNIFSESWSVVKTKVSWAQENLFWWRAFDPNCPIDDIHIWNQVWAGCNSTLGDGLERGQIESDIGTNNYSWIIWNCYDYEENIISNDNNSVCTGSHNYMNSASNPQQYAWVFNQNEFNTIWWKFYWYDDMELACAQWWHVPTDEEWITLETYLNNGEQCRTWYGWECSWLWRSWHESVWDNNLVNILKLPLSWIRASWGDIYERRGFYSSFWSSTLVDGSYIRRHISSEEDTIRSYNSTNNSTFSVRCIKD